MGKKPQDNTVSSHVSGFLNYITYCVEQYNLSHQEMMEQENLTQDYLHKLELESPTSSERSKIARQLGICRKKRRQAKDTFEAMSPLVDWSCDPEVVKAIRKLQETLGQIRKIERHQQNRMYVPKVLKETIIKGDD
jgi:hypothetical protein